jgi:hypothetical protein
MKNAFLVEHSDKSAVAEHSTDQGHRIQSHYSSILANKTRYVDRIVRKATEIEFTLIISTGNVAFL